MPRFHSLLSPARRLRLILPALAPLAFLVFALPGCKNNEGSGDGVTAATSVRMDELRQVILTRTTTRRGQPRRVVGGKLDKRTLSAGERFVVRVVWTPEGDFRDWDEVRGYALEIAAALRTSAAPAPHRLEKGRLENQR